MTQSIHTITDVVTALLLSAALVLSGMLMARRLTESPFYRQSQIIRSIFSGMESSDESPDWGKLLTNARNRDVLLKFAGAMANAYVNFELIPINEAETFFAIYGSMDESVEIEEFSYQRKNLIIKGVAADESAYDTFVAELKETGHFEQVTSHRYTDTDDIFRFEIECIASP